MTARHLFLGGVALVVLVSGGPASGEEGLIALNTSDASCQDDSGHSYVDCGNGTVTDNRSGLVWLANANCFGQLDWNDAMALVAGLGDLPNTACEGMEPAECDCGLRDHSSPGEWRLPSMAEWKTMMSVGWDADQCSVAIANDMGNGCWSQACADGGMCSLHNVQASSYWSASSFVAEPTYAWLGDLARGVIDMIAREDSAYVWPVRGGQ